MKNKYSKKTVILALLLVIVLLMIFAAFCRPLMRLLGFEYAGIGDFYKSNYSHKRKNPKLLQHTCHI